MALPPVRPALKSALYLAALAAAAAYYFTAFPLPHFLLRVKEILLAAMILMAAAGCGNRLITYLKVRPLLSGLEEFCFSILTGLGMLASTMIVLGLLQAWTPAGACVLILLAMLSGLPFFQRIGKTIQSGDLRWDQPLAGIPFFLVCAGAVISFLLALAPITYYDSLVYHLALPSTYIQAHHWVAAKELIYSAFPQQIEMLWTLTLLIGDAVVANLISWSLSVLLLLIVGAFGRRFLQPGTGAWAAALIALMPSFLLLSSGGYIDIGLTVFGFCSLYLVCLWYKNPSSGLLLAAGLFAGWAMGAKYTGLVPAALNAGLVYWGARETKRPARAAMAIYVLYAFAVFSPWLIKNLIYTGNPVFPFFYSWGIERLNPWLPQAAKGYFRGLTEYQSRSLPEVAQVIIDIPLKPLRFGGGADVLGDFGWAPVLWFVPALGLVAKKPSITWKLLAYAAVFFIFWAMSRPVLRFLLPLLPVLSLLAAEGWIQGLDRQMPFYRWIGRGFMVAFIASGLVIFFSVTMVVSPFSVALGFESPETYLQRKINYYGAAAFVNTQLPPDARVFVVGDQRGYYYERPREVTPVFFTNPLVAWVNEAVDATALRQRLRQQGFTYLVINRPEMERLKPYDFLTFSAKGERTWRTLQWKLPRLYHDAACDVYSL